MRMDATALHTTQNDAHLISHAAGSSFSLLSAADTAVAIVLPSP